ncbi:MAG: hypothetical protein LQ340_007403 [Diploschistes diacapsis]|nr:MAG: hypothetical protein LQ340_007403 [Diploschistes diacapsis]
MASEVLSRPQDLDPTQWHAGNIRMQSLMSVPYFDNPTSPYLRPAGAMILSSSPLLAVGTLDSSGRPWTTLWGGEKGFISVMNQAMLGVNMVVDRRHDPVIKACRGSTDNGKIFGGGQVISALGIDLETRQRVKLSGKVAGAALNGVEGETTAHGQMVLQVESSLSNCPKYLNAKHIRPTIPLPQPEPSSLPLSPSALSLISKADLFFLTSSASGTHLSTNYRGGPRGFIRIVSSTPSSTQLAYPEYSGNRLYQTLGNLHVTPLTGIVIPDFTTGDALYATCSAEIHVSPAAAALIPRSNLVIVLTLTKALFVRSSLAFRAAADLSSPSPYNPPVRPLATESAKTISISAARHRHAHRPHEVDADRRPPGIRDGRARVVEERAARCAVFRRRAGRRLRAHERRGPGVAERRPRAQLHADVACSCSRVAAGRTGG